MALEGRPSSSEGSESCSDTVWQHGDASSSSSSSNNAYGSDSFEDSVDEGAVSIASATRVPDDEEVSLEASRPRQYVVCSKATIINRNTSSPLSGQRVPFDINSGKSSGNKEDLLPAGRCAAQDNTDFGPSRSPVFRHDDQGTADGNVVAANGINSNNEQQAREMSPPDGLSTEQVLLLGETKDGGRIRDDHQDNGLQRVDLSLLRVETSTSISSTVRSTQVSQPPARGDATLSEATGREEDATRNAPAQAALHTRLAAWDIPPIFPCPPLNIPTTTTSRYRATSAAAGYETGGCSSHSADHGSSSNSNSDTQQQQHISVGSVRGVYSAKVIFDGGWLDKIRRAHRHSSSSSSTNSMLTLDNARSREAPGALKAPDQGKGGELRHSKTTEEHQQRSTPSSSFAVQQYPPWRDANQEKTSVLLGDGGVKNIAEHIRRKGVDETRSAALVTSTRRTFNRVWSPSQWNTLQPRRTTQVHTYRSQKIVPRSVIGRIQALTALETIKILPPRTTRTCSADGSPKGSRGGLSQLRQRRTQNRSSRTKKRPHCEQIVGISTYASIKAENLRTRRDHEAWLARVAAGRDDPIYDPLSLMGECLEHHRQALGRARDVPPPSPPRASPLLRVPNGNTGGDGRDSAVDIVCRKAAERRFALSVPRLEDLVIAARDLLSEKKEEHIAPEGEEGTKLRARVAGRLFFGGSQCENGGQRDDAGATVEEMTKRGVGEGCVNFSRPRPGTTTPTIVVVKVVVAAGELQNALLTKREDERGAESYHTAAAAAVAAEGLGGGGRGRRACSSCLLRKTNGSIPGSRGGKDGDRNEAVEEFARRCLAENKMLK